MFNVSDQLDGESEVIELEGRVGPGARMSALNLNLCDGALDIGC